MARLVRKAFLAGVSIAWTENHLQEDFISRGFRPGTSRLGVRERGQGITEKHVPCYRDVNITSNRRALERTG